jgi:putative redox protein
MKIKEHISLIRSVNTGPKLFTINEVRGFIIHSDEPSDKGGDNLAPTPFDLINSALASCTLIFLRNYCAKNKIDVGEIRVKVKMFKNESKSLTFERTISIENNLSDYERKIILVQSNFSPTTLLLEKSNIIHTSLN